MLVRLQCSAASLSEAGHLLPVSRYQVNSSAKAGLLSRFCWPYISLPSSPQKVETYPPYLSIKLFPTTQSLVAPTSVLRKEGTLWFDCCEISADVRSQQNVL